MVFSLDAAASEQPRAVRDPATAYGARLNAKCEPANLNWSRINNRINSRLETRLSLRIERYQPDSVANSVAAFGMQPTDNVRVGTQTTLSPLVVVGIASKCNFIGAAFTRADRRHHAATLTRSSIAPFNALRGRMATSRLRGARFSPDISFALLATLFVILWLAGGASREDVTGQIVSRAAAWFAIVVAVLFARRPRIEEAKEATIAIVAAILLCIVQLVPLPPDVWRALPGRAAFSNQIVSPPDLWRPMSLAPGATVNALFSLAVPLAVLLLATGVPKEQKRWIPVVVLAVISLALLVGLLQFTGAQVINPFVNGGYREVDGLFANRNHFALFLAIGLLIAPVWGVEGGKLSRARAPIALGLVLLLVLTILASGSRGGIALGAIALVLGLTIARQGVKSALRRYPRWTLPAVGIGIVALIALFVLASVSADRAVSIDRLAELNTGEDMRRRGLPAILAIIRTYFPIGTGLGSFDPIFRMHEPLSLLKPTYFNHAHNDFLEIVLTAGLPGLILMVVAIGWWAWRSIDVWRNDKVPPKLGSAMLLLILLGSVVDYPARTPVIMAIAAMAAIWLGKYDATAKAPLPTTERRL